MQFIQPYVKGSLAFRQIIGKNKFFVQRARKEFLRIWSVKYRPYALF